tara:strand:- start:1595 stop:1990 length:396 start_codon:yes stop_codon:yes gene_type:complete
MSSKIKILREDYPTLINDDTEIKYDEGWHNIVEGMLAAIKIYEDANLGISNLTPVYISKIESKFGALDVEFDGGDDVVQEIVIFSKTLSFKTCEKCGKLGKLYCSTKWMKWSYKKVLCTAHAVELYYYSIE